MLILSFDFGIKNIGVAVGQKLTFTAHALNALPAKLGIPNWNQVNSLLLEWEPKFILVGLPLNMDGSRQKITKKAEKFAELLKKKFNLHVELYDERLSTVEAKSILFKQGGFRALKKDKIDSLSAVIILESWFLNTCS
ncbi:MAG TPA: Holliday junction resolvase RuvX [Buchnera sp. (in: enterobacteria)]|nr:Holliday junction resolvase RuvX [Buchnera sp. (in: enterobacteria)]